MATARLTALGSFLAAATLVVSQPVPENAGVVILVGWTGLGLLGFGVAMGYRGGITAAAVAFVARAALYSPFEIEPRPPLWGQVLLIVLMVELGSLSFSARSRPVDPLRAAMRALVMALAAAAVVEVLSSIVDGARVSGSLVRVAGVVAALIGAGWVAWIWRRSGLSG